MNVVFLPAAEQELKDILDFYRQQKSGLTDSFLNEFLSTIEIIRLYPEGYQLITRKTRKCLLRRFPYMVLYGLIDNTIVISAIAHQHRHPRKYLSPAREKHS